LHVFRLRCSEALLFRAFLKLTTADEFLFSFASHRAQQRNRQGLGANEVEAPNDNDNEYDAYRKRMMLAYRFRPNPLVKKYFYHSENYIKVTLILGANEQRGDFEVT
jgi:hypothetical protein